jgi:hypothetical protein
MKREKREKEREE